MVGAWIKTVQGWPQESERLANGSQTKHHLLHCGPFPRFANISLHIRLIIVMYKRPRLAAPHTLTLAVRRVEPPSGVRPAGARVGVCSLSSK